MTIKLRPANGSLSSLLAVAVAALCVHGVQCGFIDMDTPLDKRTTKSMIDGTVYHLVMSDEFNTPNRTFTDGHDPVWTALDKPDDDSSSAGGGSQQFYNSSFVSTTEDGMLKISTKIGKTTWNRYDPVKKHWKEEKAYYNSGMVQSWEKFCFTGGILEVDVIFPGDPYIGGLWPAVWMMGNLGRATYESSTNMIWPWSFDKCDRKLQPAQTISACNAQNHFGMTPYQGRGATEIDIVEVMTGEPAGPLPSTLPPIELPYADMTLQVAPGVTKNRPPNGARPLYHLPENYTERHPPVINKWYEGIQFFGNTSINPFFYGTYLDETKPGEPVTRSKKQAFQADAVGGAHQLTANHFARMHTFRLEWQPGPGGRLDWFVKGHKVNDTYTMEGDGKGTDWSRAFSIKDEVLNKTMGSQIPIEPSYLIMNTAVSSTWGFPYDTPSSCNKCYDCDDPKCACTFHSGFCSMLRDDDVAMYVDSVRVYQSRDDSAHVGQPHTLGCDPVEYPTRGWIKGHSYRYMRNAPFSYSDKGPIKKVQKGGGKCRTDQDCGGHLNDVNLTEVYNTPEESRKTRTLEEMENESIQGRGYCVNIQDFEGMFSSSNKDNNNNAILGGSICKCNPGYTGPHCLAQEHVDDTVSAFTLRNERTVFTSIPKFHATPFMIITIAALFIQAIIVACIVTTRRKKSVAKEVSMSSSYLSSSASRPPVLHVSMEDSTITGRSI